MSFYFAPYRLAEIAMDIESSGVQYYSELAKRTTDEKAKKVFSFLSDQEILHRESFAKIKKQSKETEQECEYAIDLLAQMEAIAADIKGSIERYLSQNSRGFNLSEAFDVGIQTETKSIQAYTLMKDQLIDMFAMTLVHILGQEEAHLATLVDLKANNSV